MQILTYVLTKANVNNTLHILLLYTFKYLSFLEDAFVIMMIVLDFKQS